METFRDIARSFFALLDFDIILVAGDHMRLNHRSIAFAKCFYLPCRLLCKILVPVRQMHFVGIFIDS